MALRKELLEYGIFKSTFELNKKIIDNIIDEFSEFSNTSNLHEKSELNVSVSELEKEKIDNINKNLGLTYSQLYIIGVVKLLQELKTSKPK